MKFSPLIGSFTEITVKLFIVFKLYDIFAVLYNDFHFCACIFLYFLINLKFNFKSMQYFDLEIELIYGTVFGLGSGNTFDYLIELVLWEISVWRSRVKVSRDSISRVKVIHERVLRV